MKQSDKLLFGLFFGASFPVFFGLVSTVIWFMFFQSYDPVWFLIDGLLAGIIIDAIYLKKLINNLFELPLWGCSAFYLFYNIVMYGFFMGLPVFNLIMGVIAGYYIGRKISYKNITSPQKELLVKKVCLFTALVMLLICLSTGFLALNEKTIGEELQHMFRLKFEVTKSIIIGIILAGGITLIVSQYLLTRLIITRMIRR
jgi:uncharacterized membrane protein YraQ (UPF0718 family)